MKLHHIIIGIAILLVSVCSALAVDEHMILVLRPKVDSLSSPSTQFTYQFNFTDDSDCSGTLYSYNETVITDSDGITYVDLNISQFTHMPMYLCEYRDGTLRKIHRKSPFISSMGDTMHGDLTFDDGGAIRNVDYIDFNITASPSHQEGRMHWNSDDGTLEVGMPGGTVVGQVFEEGLMRVRANETMVSGTAVYDCGSTGQRPIVCPADWDSPSTSVVSCILTEDIQSGQFGYCNIYGFNRDINTTGVGSSCSNNENAYLADDGMMTCDFPSADKVRVVLGKVVYSHHTTGILNVNIDYIPGILALSYVDGTGLKNNSIVQYDADAGYFKMEDSPTFENLTVNGNFTGNQIYGGMYIYNSSATTVLTAINTYSNVTEGLTAGHINGFIFDGTSLETIVPGHYKIDASISYGGTPNNEYHLTIGIDGVEQPRCHNRRKLGASGDVGNVGVACILELQQGYRLTLMVENEDSDGDASIVDANVVFTRIGDVG